jgi:signal peptidase II
VIGLIAAAVAIVIVRMGLQSVQRSWAVGLGIVLGGALGNLVDRALRSGHGFLGGRVVDWIDLQWWPVFNVADAALWVGIGVLLVASRHVGGRQP